MAPVEEFPSLGTVKARGKTTVSRREKRSAKSCFKSRPKFRPLQEDKDPSETAHPCLEYQEDASTTISNMGPEVVREMMSIVGTQSTDTAIQLTRSCEVMRMLGTSINHIWKKATEKDFKSSQPVTGVTPYRFYQFLCRCKSFEGKYIINKVASRKAENCPIVITVCLVEIELKTTGLLLSIWRRWTYEDHIVKDDSFLAATVSKSNSITGIMDSCLTDVQVSRKEMEQKEDWNVNDWLDEGRSMEDWLLFSAARAFLFDEIESLILSRHLIPLPKNYKSSIKSVYLMPDGALPQSLPKTGLFEEAYSGVQVLVSYSGCTMEISKVLDQHSRFFGPNIYVHLSSAMVMSEDQQEKFNHHEYMDFNKGLEGNPNKFEALRRFIPPRRYHAKQINVRAWYTAVPPVNPRKTNHWKVMVRSHHSFVVMRFNRLLYLTRIDDIE